MTTLIKVYVAARCAWVGRGAELKQGRREARQGEDGYSWREAGRRAHLLPFTIYSLRHNSVSGLWFLLHGCVGSRRSLGQSGEEGSMVGGLYKAWVACTGMSCSIFVTLRSVTFETSEFRFV